MITPTQMRAARAILDLTQGEAAARIGIAANTLSKIESGQADPPASRVREIQVFYENLDVEFTPNDGVRRKETHVYTISGRNNFILFFDAMYEKVKEAKELYACNIDERTFDKWLGEKADDHTHRMESIEGLECLTLVEEGNDYFPCESYTEYRWVKKGYFEPSPFYVFGDMVAILLFEEEKNVTIIVIHHPDVARAYKKQFFMAWESALIPTDKEDKYA